MWSISLRIRYGGRWFCSTLRYFSSVLVGFLDFGEIRLSIKLMALLPFGIFPSVWLVVLLDLGYSLRFYTVISFLSFEDFHVSLARESTFTPFTLER